ncbi:MAG TPA: hypothetical protein ENJ18_16650 [Nannocystis exedens]|nr:hypothetical protein [Nannocystis exedens]
MTRLLSLRFKPVSQYRPADQAFDLSTGLSRALLLSLLLADAVEVSPDSTHVPDTALSGTVTEAGDVYFPDTSFFRIHIPTSTGQGGDSLTDLFDAMGT